MRATSEEFQLEELFVRRESVSGTLTCATAVRQHCSHRMAVSVTPASANVPSRPKRRVRSQDRDASAAPDPSPRRMPRSSTGSSSSCSRTIACPVGRQARCDRVAEHGRGEARCEERSCRRDETVEDDNRIARGASERYILVRTPNCSRRRREEPIAPSGSGLVRLEHRADDADLARHALEIDARAGGRIASAWSRPRTRRRACGRSGRFSVIPIPPRPRHSRAAGARGRRGRHRRGRRGSHRRAPSRGPLRRIGTPADDGQLPGLQ